MASGVRREPGAHRERRRAAVPTGRVRRGYGRAAPGPQGRTGIGQAGVGPATGADALRGEQLEHPRRGDLGGARQFPALHSLKADGLGGRGPRRQRSEEHTSELQSLAYLVCRLLLEKKKKKTNN